MKRLFVLGVLVALLTIFLPAKTAYAKTTEEDLKSLGEAGVLGDTALYRLVVVPLKDGTSSSSDYAVVGIIKTTGNGVGYYTPVVYRVKGNTKYVSECFTSTTFSKTEVTSYAEIVQDFEIGDGQSGKNNGVRDGNTHINLIGGWSKSNCPFSYQTRYGTYLCDQDSDKLQYVGVKELKNWIEEISETLVDGEGKPRLDTEGNTEDFRSSWISLALCIQCLSNGEFTDEGGSTLVEPDKGELAEQLLHSEVVTVLSVMSGRELLISYESRTDGDNPYTGESDVTTEKLEFYISSNTEEGYLGNFSNLMNAVWSAKVGGDISSILWSGNPSKVYISRNSLLIGWRESTYKSVPKLAQILTVYDGLTKIIQERLREQANEDSQNTVIKYVITDSMTEFEKWSVVFTKALAGQEVSADGVTQHEEYNIGNFWDWCQKPENSGKLTAEEILRLQVFYSVAVELSGRQDFLKAGNLLEQRLCSEGRWEFANQVKSLAGGTATLTINRFGYNLTTLRNNALIVGKDTKFFHTNNTVIVAVMNNFLDAAKYYAVQVYGVKTKGSLFSSTKEEEDIVDIDRNDSLETILSRTPLQDGKGNMTGITWSQVPAVMARLRGMAVDEESYEAYKTLQYALMLANTYACNPFYSGLEEVEDEQGNVTYKNAAIDDYRQRWDGQEVLDTENSAVYAYAQAYTQILKGFDYLGVEPFSPQLEVLCEYANWLKGIVDVSDLDLAGMIDRETEPLSNFFSVDTKTFSYYYNLGVALSASYVPMQTNMYDVSSLAMLDDVNFVEQFHYPYGFFRKALYIDTDINAAVNLYVSGRRGNRRVATLGDLLECDRDIVLYVDEKFYNVDTLANIQEFKYNKVLNTEDSEDLEPEGFGEKLWNTLVEGLGFHTVTADELVKTGGYSVYSDNVRKDVTAQYVRGAKDAKGSGMVLSSAEIDTYMTGYSESEKDKVYNEYTPLQGFAVVSAIYKKVQLYSVVASQTESSSPVFISSPSLAGIEGVTQEYWNSICNYLMLKNLPGNMSMDYKTTLDIDSPVYMDIYGNILTESGLVIIPAAANPTLQNATSYDVHTAAFLTLADNGYYEIPSDYNNAEKYALGLNRETGTTTGDFILDEAAGVYQIAPKKINGIYYNFRDLPIGDRDVLVSLVNLHKQRLATGKNIKFDKRVYVVTEVLRGAPLEWIDKQKEGLGTTGSVSKGGVYAAAKLEEISDTLFSSSNGNSLISLPNMAFMEHYEVVIMFLYKILFAFLVAVMFVKVYMDVVQRKFGLRSIMSFLFTVAVFVIVLYSIPEVLNISYYATNKILLQKEASSIAMLNLEKRSDGQEVGVTSVRIPETKTTLYLKMDDVNIAWYEAAGKVLSVNSMDTMQEIYSSATADSVMAQLDGTIVRGNAVYMDIDDIFDATKFEYDSKTKSLKNVAVKTPYASYITPYFAILDCLVARVNDYNKKNDTYAFTTAVQSKGAVRTRGLAQGYFTSLLFMEQSQDPSTMFAVYGLSTGLVEVSPFKAADYERMSKSLWHADIGDEEVRAKLAKLNEKAREFIAENHTVIGKVSDETFLKVMALYLAVEHNKIFRCQYGSALELFDIDTRDIMRLSMADRASALNGASKSFARFVYDAAGGIGVVSTLFLVVVYFLMSIVKPVMVVIILATMLITLGVRRLFKRDQEHVVEGFIVSMLLLCGTNILYALMLKLSMLLPKLGLPMFVAVFAQIFVQVVYGGLMYLLLQLILKDWKNLGYATYKQKVQNLAVANAVFQKIGTPAVVRTMVPVVAQEYTATMRRAADSRKHVTKGVTGADILKQMRVREDHVRRGSKLNGKE